MSLRKLLARLLPILAGLAVTIALLALFSTASTCRGLYADTLRLHIRAASDSAADQSLKLLVRDEIVSLTADLTATAPDAASAREILSENLPLLTARAESILREKGSAAPVSAAIAPTWFSTRSYETSAGKITLPAGRYQALVLTIGAGEGHNWWCVLYPSLCLPAAEAELTELLSAMPPDRRALIVGDRAVTFWVVEAWTKLAAWFAGEKISMR